MGSALNSATVAFLVADEGAGKSELQQPWQTVTEEAARCSSGPNTLVTSGKPADLPTFSATFIPIFASAR